MKIHWIDIKFVYDHHDRIISESGGLAGVPNRNLVESAIHRPVMMKDYADLDIVDIAAAYAYGIVKNHGFADGNKRTAWQVAAVFLENNNYEIDHNPSDPIDAAEAKDVMKSLADGSITEEKFAAWLRQRTKMIDHEDQ